MSFDGHVLCQRMLIGPCALTTLGAATVAAVATAAPVRNLRRVADFDVRNCSVVIGHCPPWLSRISSRHSRSRLGYEPSGQVPYSGGAGCVACYRFKLVAHCR